MAFRDEAPGVKWHYCSVYVVIVIFLLSVSQMFYAVGYGYGVLSCETMLILKNRAKT